MTCASPPLAFANSLGNTDEAAMTVLCLCPVHSLAFSVQPRRGVSGCLHLCCVPEGHLALPTLSVGKTLFFAIRECVFISLGVFLCFSLFTLRLIAFSYVYGHMDFFFCKAGHFSVVSSVSFVLFQNSLHILDPSLLLVLHMPYLFSSSLMTFLWCFLVNRILILM